MAQNFEGKNTEHKHVSISYSQYFQTHFQGGISVVSLLQFTVTNGNPTTEELYGFALLGMHNDQIFQVKSSCSTRIFFPAFLGVQRGASK